MGNRKGIGLLGLLIAVVIMAILLSVVLKRYAGQTRRLMSLPASVAPAAASGENPASPKGAAACKGRLVGNICVPTEARSASLDAFERMNQ